MVPKLVIPRFHVVLNYATIDLNGSGTYPDERINRRERPPPGLFTSIKLPEAEPPNGVAPLLDFPRGRMRPVTFLGEGPHGTVTKMSSHNFTCQGKRRWTLFERVIKPKLLVNCNLLITA
ncbi:unnamed protein product [Leptosia nina]|uniref:Uncharacterized protein n=1 Tax=Leptosia nina TaxID=320188 RepID=A0AAV1K0D5_9NEOP